MKISVVGTGYVGLVSGTCFAEIGHEVTCIDIVKEKIEMLNNGKVPIYEPGLEELIERNTQANRLFFSTNYDSVKNSEVVFLAVGTPSSDNGEANLEYLHQAAQETFKQACENCVVVIKSTVPVGVSKEFKALADSFKKNILIVNNPEFLKEGSAIDDFMKPERDVIGADSDEAFKLMDEIYAPLVKQGNPLLKMSNLSAEMTKYAANCFLATKISFINEIARLCDSTGADIEQVRDGIKTDTRIGAHFLYPGPGYGGSCFPKDVKALLRVAEKNGTTLKIVSAAEKVNEEQKEYVFQKMMKYFSNDIKGKTFTFWGVAFKANTDDIRETAAITLAQKITQAGGSVRFYDPIAGDNFLTYMKNQGIHTQSVQDKYKALDGADGLVIVTEWREFNNPEYSKIRESLKTKVIFDARNLLNGQKAKDNQLDYFSIGKQI